MIRRPRAPRERGFTLIELMISITVLTIALIGMLGLYRTAATANSFARRFTAAHELAASRLETLRPFPLDSVRSGAGQVTDIAESGVTYHVQHQVETDVGGNPNIYRITALASFGQDGDEAQQATARLEVLRTVQEGL